MRKIIDLSPWRGFKGGIVWGGVGERYEEDGQIVGHEERLVLF
jgi:hypothetical protein